MIGLRPRIGEFGRLPSAMDATMDAKDFPRPSRPSGGAFYIPTTLKLID
jgi:hypothetical protein